MSDFWRGRVTFVTGATGLLGGWLVRHLLDQEARVVCLVRDWVPDSLLFEEGLDKRVRIVRGEVQDQAAMERILGEHEVDTVFHLAAQTIVGIANRNPVSTFESNIQGTWSLLEACRRSPLVRQIVVASSDKAYGAQTVLPYTEDTPLQGKHPYDVSKSCADLIAQSYAHSFGLPVCVTRCGNLYGGGDLNLNRLIPGTIESVRRGESPVIRSDGQFVRDYFYVEDAAEAYMALAEGMANDRSLCGQAFNFSSDQTATALEVVETILRVMDSSLAPTILNQASNEIREQHLDSARARAALDWRPRHDLAQGLAKTIPWYAAR
ncbi:MAG: NAD-dependent epimerase/dehydratase family protein [Fimbriimonas sp.]